MICVIADGDARHDLSENTAQSKPPIFSRKQFRLPVVPQRVEIRPMPPLVIERPESLSKFVGREIAVTDWLTVTQEMIRQFAELTDDRQWIHVEPERAKKESPYGTTIAHGFLTLSLLGRFLREAIEVKSGAGMRVNYGLNRVRFPAPVGAESQLRARVSIQSTRELPDAIEAIYSVVVECRGADKPSCVAECIIRYYHG